jgi:hypothetical protein
MTVALGNRNFHLRGCYKPWCKAWWIIPDRAWLIHSKGNVVPDTSINTLQMWRGRPSGCSDPFVWEKVCFGDSDGWKVWQVPVNLAKDSLRMVSLEELQDASLCWRSKRTVAPHEWQRGWLLGLLPLMCSKWTAPTIDFGSHHCWRKLGVGSHLCWRRAGAIAPLLLIKGHREREQNMRDCECSREVRVWWECEERIREKEELLPYAAVCESWE